MGLSEGLQDQLKAAAVLGAFAWVFNSIGGLQHGQDTMLKDVASHGVQLRDVWEKYNVNEEEEKDNMKAEFAVYKDIMKRLHDTEISVKDAEIASLKREQAR